MRANLRRRLEILEAAHGKTPLAMGHIRAVNSMTEEERDKELETLSSSSIFKIRQIWPEHTEIECQWIIYFLTGDLPQKVNELDIENELDIRKLYFSLL